MNYKLKYEELQQSYDNLLAEREDVASQLEHTQEEASAICSQWKEAATNAKQAKDQLTNKLKTAQQLIAKYENESHKNSAESFSKIQQLEDSLEDKETHYNMAQSEISALKLALADVKQENQLLKLKSTALLEDISTMNGKFEDQATKYTECERLLGIANSDKGALETQLSDLHKNMSNSQAEFEACKARHQEASALVELLQKEALEAQEQIENLRQYQNSTIWCEKEVVTSLENELNELAGKHDKLRHKYDIQMEEYQHLSEQYNRMQCKYENTLEELSTKHKDIEKANQNEAEQIKLTQKLQLLLEDSLRKEQQVRITLEAELKDQKDQYQALSETLALKSLENEELNEKIILIRSDKEDIQAKFDEVLAKNKLLQCDIIQAQSEVQSIQALLDTEKRRNTDLALELDEKNSSIISISSLKQKIHAKQIELDVDRNQLIEQLNDKDRQIEQHQRNAANTSQSLSDLNAKCDALKAEAAAHLAKSEELGGSLAALAAQHAGDMRAVQGRLDAAEAELCAATGAKQAAEAHLSRLLTAAQQQAEEAAGAEAQLAALQQRAEAQAAAVAEGRAREAELRAQVAAMADDQSAKAAAAQGRVEAVEQALIDRQGEISRLKATVIDLQNGTIELQTIVNKEKNEHMLAAADFASKHTQYTDEVTLLRNKCEGLCNELSVGNAHKSELEHSLQQARDGCKELEETVDVMQKEQCQLREATSDFQDKISELMRENEALTVRQAKLRKIIAGQEAMLEKLRVNEMQLSKSIANTAASEKAQTAALERLETQWASTTHQISEYKEKYDALDNEYNQCKAELVLEKQKLQKSKTMFNELKGRYVELSSSFQSIKQDFSASQLNQQDTEGKYSILQQRFNDLEKIYSGTKDTLSELLVEKAKWTAKRSEASEMNIIDTEDKDMRIDFLTAKNTELMEELTLKNKDLKELKATLQNLFECSKFQEEQYDLAIKENLKLRQIGSKDPSSTENRVYTSGMKDIPLNASNIYQSTKRSQPFSQEGVENTPKRNRTEYQ